ncbi:hypothetical protein RI367_007601 [Sorochytrium milnesiophthora]
MTTRRSRSADGQVPVQDVAMQEDLDTRIQQAIAGVEERTHATLSNVLARMEQMLTASTAASHNEIAQLRELVTHNIPTVTAQAVPTPAEPIRAAPPAVVQHRLQLPSFAGNPPTSTTLELATEDDVEVFLDNFLLYAEATHLTSDAQRLMALQQSLRNPALKWYLTLRQSIGSGLTWALTEEAMRARYARPLLREQRRAAFFTIHQELHETVVAYTERFRLLQTSAPDVTTSAIELYVRGLLPKVQKYTRSLAPRSLEEAMRVAQGRENAVQVTHQVTAPLTTSIDKLQHAAAVFDNTTPMELDTVRGRAQ